MTPTTLNLTLTTRLKYFVCSYCDFYMELLWRPTSER